MGMSYIDARCGSGHGMPDIKNFVDCDHELARKIPALAGKREEFVKGYWDSLKPKASAKS